MSDQYPFFAYLSRMRYINRWGLMRNTFQENIQEHSHMVAVLAHALAVIRRDVFGGDADPGLAAAAALYHDAPEILTGDLPTPIKYYNPDIRDAYREVEQFSAHKLLHMLLRPSAPPLPPCCGRATTPGSEHWSRPPTSSRPTSNAWRSSRRATPNSSRPRSRRWRPCRAMVCPSWTTFWSTSCPPSG